jgi:hypothetical protein
LHFFQKLFSFTSNRCDLVIVDAIDELLNINPSILTFVLELGIGVDRAPEVIMNSLRAEHGSSNGLRVMAIAGDLRALMLEYQWCSLARMPGIA